MLKNVNYFIFVSLLIISGSVNSANEPNRELSKITVSSMPYKKYIYLDGTVEAVQQATLFAQTSGRVIKLNYDVDDFVKKGSVIAQLRDNEQKARLKQSKAGFNLAKAQLKEAELEYARVSDLYSRKLVSASLKDKADASLMSSKAQYNAANARLDEALEQFEHTIIRAPFNGTVTKRHIELGETLQIGQAIISGVAEQKALRFNVQVPQRLIQKARNLSTVTIILDDGRRFVSDQITIFPTADKRTHSFQLRAQVFSDQQYHLYPGMFVKVAIETGLNHHIMVPSNSVIHRSELSAVYVLTTNNTIQLRAVKLGQVFENNHIVLAGLVPGDVVLTEPNLAAIAIKAQRQGE